MRILYAILLTAATLTATGLGTGAGAQLPFPFDQAPDFMQRPQCTRAYVRRFCGLIEFGSAWLGNKPPEDKRKERRRLLGVDVDLDQFAARCRTGQDAIARELAIMLRRAKAELMRCDDTI
jgi:hypothetical protein